MRCSKPPRLCAVATLLLVAAGSSWAAPPLMQNPPEIQRRVAALVQGTYTGTHCGGTPEASGPGARQLRIGGDGTLTVGPVSQPMFAAGQEVGVGWRGGAQPEFSLEVVAPERLARVTSMDKEGPGIGYVEIGRGVNNVSEGWTCAGLDMRALPLLSPAQPLRALMAELYDTGGREVTGQCRNLGRKVNGKRVGGETRSASYSVSREAVVLNGDRLPMQQVADLNLGSRLDDGAINGSFKWADGRGLHIEQFAGMALSVAMFSFSEGEARWHCEPKR